MMDISNFDTSAEFVKWGFFGKESNHERLKQEFNDLYIATRKEKRKAENENNEIDVKIHKKLHPDGENKSLKAKANEYYGRTNEVKRMLETKYDNIKKIGEIMIKMDKLDTLKNDFNARYESAEFEANTKAVRNELEENFEKDFKELSVDSNIGEYSKEKEKWVEKRMIEFKLIKKKKHFILF